MNDGRPYQVYLLRNAAGRGYIGISENVSNRLAQHNAGASQWTAKYGPWSLVWTSRPCSLGDARRLENQLKRQKGGDGLGVLLSEHGIFVNLSSGL
jgi:putative endonuclease